MSLHNYMTGDANPMSTATTHNNENKRPWWHWALGGFGALIVISAIAQIGDDEESATQAANEQPYVQQDQANQMQQPDNQPQHVQDNQAPQAAQPAQQQPAQQQANNVPTEYTSALKQAESHSRIFHPSKQDLYDYLTNDFTQFSPEAAQYAVDNANIDYKQNALESARSYQKTMNMSPQAIYDQLTSFTEQFTPEEAQYAINNL